MSKLLIGCKKHLNSQLQKKNLTSGDGKKYSNLVKKIINNWQLSDLKPNKTFVLTAKSLENSKID